MIKAVRYLWNIIFEGTPFEWHSWENKKVTEEDAWDAYREFQARKTREFIDNETSDAYKEIELEKQRYQAIAACDGCEEEVFVLRENGKEIGYYCNLNQLALKNSFHPGSIYNYYNMRTSIEQPFKEKYTILNYSSVSN